MSNLVDALSLLREQAAGVAAQAHREVQFHGAADDDLVDAVAVVGDMLRLVEGLLVEGAGELAERSRSFDRDARLTTRRGCRDVSELLQRLTRCSPQTAARYVKAQKAVAPEWDSLTGEQRPAMLPAMREALVDGVVGIDGTLAVAQPALAMRERVGRANVLMVDEVLAAHARGEGPDAAPPACADILRVHAQVWAAALDPDGAEPAERDAAFRRSLTFGTARHGVIPFRGNLLPEVAAQLRLIIDATSSPRANRVRFAEPDESVVSADDEPSVFDDRTRPQKQHDALAIALTAAAASRDLPTIGGAAPTLVVSVREEDLAREDGWAHADGSDLPVTLHAARHVGCSGVIQRVALDTAGRIRRLGTEERVFNRHQRRAIALRDGGCLIPGCTVPAAWCEIHHVIEHAQGGPTHTSNGVLLCRWHRAPRGAVLIGGDVRSLPLARRGGPGKLRAA